ncbi:hypothetical protein SEVIR_4G251601v4 [Setaria viridis]|uniref:Uncharacterized protein n=1 Tax=Setaria viridis TaxID=4556 RepID=A0A4U6VFA8_SETVI|nr:hypothetical protein SEVIR_4G251601v2 [Setaria viridis]
MQRSYPSIYFFILGRSHDILGYGLRVLNLPTGWVVGSWNQSYTMGTGLQEAIFAGVLIINSTTCYCYFFQVPALAVESAGGPDSRSRSTTRLSEGACPASCSPAAAAAGRLQADSKIFWLPRSSSPPSQMDAGCVQNQADKCMHTADIKSDGCSAVECPLKSLRTLTPLPVYVVPTRFSFSARTFTTVFLRRSSFRVKSKPACCMVSFSFLNNQ